MRPVVISSIRRRFQRLSQSQGQVTHVLLTRSPLIHPASWASSFDLHVLSTPPAFVLSQDQTLRKKIQTQHPKASDRVDSDCRLSTDNLQSKRNCIITQPANRPGTRTINKLALTMCTLLSSQGPDALAPRLEFELQPQGLCSWLATGCSSDPEVQWLIPRGENRWACHPRRRSDPAQGPI
jgi:hypothetical protein